MSNAITGEYRMKDCDCKVIVKPMSKRVECCDKHKDVKGWKDAMLRVAHKQANPYIPFNPIKLF